jgi:hypothetical protein
MGSMVLLLVLAVLQSSGLAMDVSNAKVSGQAVAGVLGGKNFFPSRVILKRLGKTSVASFGKTHDESVQHTLSFESGDDFMPDHQIELWLVYDDGHPLAPRVWHWKPTKFNTDAWQKQSYPVEHPGGGVARGITCIMTSRKQGIFQDSFSANLQFDKVVGDTVYGSIALMLPDSQHSYLNGRFKAKIEK